MPNQRHEVEILLIEDNEGDILLMQEALRMGGYNNRLSIAKDGFEGLAYLRKEGAFKDRKTPGLIIMDLNLPKMNGEEVLAEIKRMEKLKNVPLAVLSNSQAPQDKAIGEQYPACRYFIKPSEFKEFMQLISTLILFAEGRE